ncbi:hypothetical protein EYZ11_010032 [Aspergillus tanneri]|nr:hypothetical protein EYZ11_010032 [Aspergillus tanneri]
MIGSILSDVLLVFGCCLVSASYNKDVLYFNTAVAQSLSSLMTITAVTIILPTALYSTFPSANLEDTIISFSRSTSIVLLALYVGYLYFHLGTHKHLFESQKPDDSNESPRHGTPHSTYITSTLKLVAAAIVTVICTRFLFESIHGTTKVTGLTKTFIAVILIPIASNSPEGTAVIAAAQVGDVDSAIGVIVNSTLQIGLFVIPFLVILGWMIYQPMTLYFETSHTVILFLSIIVVNHLLQDGRYTYIHGVMLVAL